MSRTVTTSNTLTVYPSGYIDDAVDGSWYSLANATNAYKAHNAGNSYATIGLTRGNNAETWIYFTFDTSDLPYGATIDSVTCTIRVYISNANSSVVASREWQLFSGQIAKGEAYTGVSNTTRTVDVTPGTWTRAELDDTRIRFYAKRGSSSTTSGVLARFYGASLNVNYSITETYYDVSTSSNSTNISFSPSSNEYLSGSSVSVTISGDISNAIVTDNGVDVTSSLSGSGTTHTYTITNISADHSIVVTVLGPDVYFKQNDNWIKADKVFVKINGAWVEASDIKVKSNGTWQ